MIKKIVFLFLFLGSSRFSDAWRGKVCSAGERCTPLTKCHHMKIKLESGKAENIQAVEKSICSFNHHTDEALVCCPQLSVPNPSSCGNSENTDKIFGGTVAPIRAYPWMAAMAYTELGKPQPSFHCSGSVISSRYILTAAHCVEKESLGPRKLEYINLGDWNLETDNDCQTINATDKICAPPHIVVKAEEVIIHPGYNKIETYADDIALIRMDKTIDFNNKKSHVLPICLPPSGLNLKDFVGDREAIAAGWGMMENHNYSNILLQTEIPILDNFKCKSHFKNLFGNNQICAGGKGGSDTCTGDSGGPLVMAGPNGPPFYQIGIVSYGYLVCGKKDNPAVYTDVIKYRDWIIANMRQ